MEKRQEESFREYAKRWKKIAVQVDPPLVEMEMTLMFLNTMPAYGRWMGKRFSSFSEMVNIGEWLENGIKDGRIVEDCKAFKLIRQELVDSKYSNDKIDNVGGILVKKAGKISAVTGKKKPSRLDPIPTSYADLYSHLNSHGMVSPRPMRAIQSPLPRGFDWNLNCKFHAGAIGHSIENCKSFKCLVQDFIDAKWLTFMGQNEGSSFQGSETIRQG